MARYLLRFECPEQACPATVAVAMARGGAGQGIELDMRADRLQLGGVWFLDITDPTSLINQEDEFGSRVKRKLLTGLFRRSTMRSTF